MTQSIARQEPIVLVIDFHHARGPEIELCFSEEGSNPAVENDWSLLPFMALSDGAHASTEDFSYFTLRREATATQNATSLFGISCTRQIAASALINRSPEVTRSTVQKAVVVVTDGPQHFGTLREKLSMVTSAWFAQRDFSDIDILKKFRESLIASLKHEEAQKGTYLGLSLREMIHTFKSQTLVLFKCLLLQPKMLFFGSRCERLCMIQFSLLSLIPGLLNNLQDCADPAFDTYAEKTEKPTSLKTSERSSLLAYMGLPLQLFGKGSIFGPYTPLQQLDLLADHGTKSYVVGSTNSLLLQQKDRYSDILINLDEVLISIHSPSLRTALALTAADRRWIDFLTQTINETWDPSHPEQPKTHGYVGSEEFIRLQFEEYLLALLSCTNHQQHVQPSSPGKIGDSRSTRQSADTESDPTLEFNPDFIAQWQTTHNYAIFQRLTSDAMLFSIVEPRHPCAGGLTIDDIQRRLAQQVSDLHLDERVREGREALNKTLATGQKKVSSAFNSFWSDIEALREAQRKRNEERAMERVSYDEKGLSDEYLPSSRNNAQQSSASTSATFSPGSGSTSAENNSFSWFGGNRRAPSVDANPAAAASQTSQLSNTAGQRTGSYLSSWGTWASERRKEWQDRRTSGTVTTTVTSSAPSPSTASPLSETAPKTPSTLPSVQEKAELNRKPNDDNTTNTTTKNGNNSRGRSSADAPRRKSEDFTMATSTNLGRSLSRRAKRWSSVLRAKEHRNSHHESEFESASVSSRSGSLDIFVPSSAVTVADAPKSPLGQVYVQSEQQPEQQSAEIETATEDSHGTSTSTHTDNEETPEVEQENGQDTNLDGSDDNIHRDEGGEK